MMNIQQASNRAQSVGEAALGLTALSSDLLYTVLSFSSQPSRTAAQVRATCKTLRDTLEQVTLATSVDGRCLYTFYHAIEPLLIGVDAPRSFEGPLEYTSVEARHAYRICVRESDPYRAFRQQIASFHEHDNPAPLLEHLSHMEDFIDEPKLKVLARALSHKRWFTSSHPAFHVLQQTLTNGYCLDQGTLFNDTAFCFASSVLGRWAIADRSVGELLRRRLHELTELNLVELDVNRVGLDLFLQGYLELVKGVDALEVLRLCFHLFSHNFDLIENGGSSAEILKQLCSHAAQSPHAREVIRFLVDQHRQEALLVRQSVLHEVAIPSLAEVAVYDRNALALLLGMVRTENSLSNYDQFQAIRALGPAARAHPEVLQMLCDLFQRSMDSLVRARGLIASHSLHGGVSVTQSEGKIESLLKAFDGMTNKTVKTLILKTLTDSESARHLNENEIALLLKGLKPYAVEKPYEIEKSEIEKNEIEKNEIEKNEIEKNEIEKRAGETLTRGAPELDYRQIRAFLCGYISTADLDRSRASRAALSVLLSVDPMLGDEALFSTLTLAAKSGSFCAKHALSSAMAARVGAFNDRYLNGGEVRA